MNDLVGRTLGRYRIISLLGEGGMGAVFKGEDPTLQRVVAVKVMHPHLARQPGFAERFLQEARSAARLDHPGIVKVYEFNQADDLLFIVMEFIPGDNLRQMLQDLQSGGKWLTLAEAVDISRQLALALDYAHRQGVLHRDIKPDNIMLKSATSADLTFQPVITDLGLAKLREGGVQTEHGTSLGTPAYMSPEQAMGQPVDARSDVYALGILLYELAVGRLPFVVKTISEAVAAHLQLTPPLPRTLRPDLPAALEQIILRALAKDPANRYPTAAAFADALARSAPDATLVAGAPPTLVASSLATQYQTSLLRPHGPSLMGSLPTPPGTGMDRLVIRGPDNTQRIVAIETTELTIGRSSNATIVLDDPKVSRSHAKITFDGARYQVLDLDSTNGTQMANARLLAGIPQEWTPENGLRIGDHWLFLQRGDQQPAVHPELMNGTVVDVVMPEARASQPVAIFIEPARLAVEAGGAATASLTLTNQGQVVDHLAVAVDGVPVSWLPATLPAARLMPGEQKTLTLTIAPPRSVESRAGDYPLTIRVASQSTSGQAAEIAATLSIAPYRQFLSQIKPEQLQAGASGQVVVQNQGNSDETYAITWSDRADELVFKPAQTQVTVLAGQTSSAIYTAGPRKRRWIGGRRQHPFSVQVTPPQGPPQNPQGAVVSSGWLPLWLLPALVFLCIAAALIAGQIPRPQRPVPAVPIPVPPGAIVPPAAPTQTPTRTARPTRTPTRTATPAAPAKSQAEAAAAKGLTELANAYNGDYSGTVVTMTRPFTDEDAVKFDSSVAAFEEATGIDIQYEGSKEFEASIIIRVQANDAPDIVDFPQPGLLSTFAAQGQVIPATDLVPERWLQQNYLESWLDMATMAGPDGTEQMYGVWHRFNAKSLVWYPLAAFEASGYEVPTTWEELQALQDMIVSDGDTPWCVGIESGAATGWPATDWTEEFMLRTTSLENYDNWITGDLPFSSPEVKNAIETFAGIWNDNAMVYGGTPAIVTTFFGDAPTPMFQDPPGCWLHKQGNFITSFFPEGTQYGVDYGVFYLPGVDPAYGKPFVVAGDIMAAFRDRPEIRAVMQFFSTGEAIRGWLAAGGALGMQKDVDLSWYGSDLERDIAVLVNDATSVRFDASDLMPGEVGFGSFWMYMTNYFSGAQPLDIVLQEIDASWPR